MRSTLTNLSIAIIGISMICGLYGCGSKTECEIEASADFTKGFNINGCDYEILVQDISHNVLSRGVDTVLEKLDNVNSESEVSKITVSEKKNAEKKIEALIVKNDINEHFYEVEHYTTNGTKVATLIIRDNNYIDDIKLHIEDVDGRIVNNHKEEPYLDCVGHMYQDVRDWYDKNYPIICDLADFFAGECVMVSILISAIDCI